MQIEIYIGFSGLFCSLIYRIPQIYKIWSRKSADDISLWMIHVQNISYILYIVYGFMINDIVYIVSSFVSIFQNLIIIIMYCCFRKKERGEVG